MHELTERPTEAYAAISAALWRRTIPGGAGVDSGLDLALGIASASSIQIATFILPLSFCWACSFTR